MSYIINYHRYRDSIKRKFPNIFYFDDSRYVRNDEVLKIMEDMRNTYPNVLCYQVKWLERKNIDLNIIYKCNNYVVCTKSSRQVCKIWPFNTSKLHNLFKTVYNDCVKNYSRIFYAILKKEKNLIFRPEQKLFDLEEPSYDISSDYQTIIKIQKKPRSYENLGKTDLEIISKDISIPETSNVFTDQISSTPNMEPIFKIFQTFDESDNQGKTLGNDYLIKTHDYSNTNNYNSHQINKNNDFNFQENKISFLELLNSDDIIYDFNDQNFYNDLQCTTIHPNVNISFNNPNEFPHDKKNVNQKYVNEQQYLQNINDNQLFNTNIQTSDKFKYSYVNQSLNQTITDRIQNFSNANVHHNNTIFDENRNDKAKFEWHHNLSPISSSKSEFTKSGYDKNYNYNPCVQNDNSFYRIENVTIDLNTNKYLINHESEKIKNISSENQNYLYSKNILKSSYKKVSKYTKKKSKSNPLSKYKIIQDKKFSGVKIRKSKTDFNEIKNIYSKSDRTKNMVRKSNCKFMNLYLRRLNEDEIKKIQLELKKKIPYQ